MLEHSAITRRNAVVEVERFMAMPGQALSYKLGQRMISRLREEARTALGDDFDVRAFHAAVLENGSMPLPILEEFVGRWRARQEGA